MRARAIGKSLVDVALNNTDRLTKMIDDLLDIEKMEAGKMTFDLRPIHVSPLVDDVVSANTNYAERFGVSLGLPPPGLPGGISGSICAHSAVRSLG